MCCLFSHLLVRLCSALRCHIRCYSLRSNRWEQGLLEGKRRTTIKILVKGGRRTIIKNVVFLIQKQILKRLRRLNPSRLHHVGLMRAHLHVHPFHNTSWSFEDMFDLRNPHADNSLPHENIYFIRKYLLCN